MSSLAEVILLGPEEEARRLWDGALVARERAADDLVALCESLDLGLRAAEILTVHRLNPIRDQFPATIGIQLEMPGPEVDAQRDGIQVPKALQFNEVIDLLSDPELTCVSPAMHRGWEDRRFSCRRSRVTAQEVIDVTLNGEEQEQLLTLAAYRNRLFRTPPPVLVRPGHILAAFAALDRLFAGLDASAAG
jgi:hypothetical protein